MWMCVFVSVLSDGVQAYKVFMSYIRFGEILFGSNGVIYYK